MMTSRERRYAYVPLSRYESNGRGLAVALPEPVRHGRVTAREGRDGTGTIIARYQRTHSHEGKG